MVNYKMDTRKILVNVGNLVASEQYSSAKTKLQAYKDWRAGKGFEPILLINGQDILGDVVCKSLEQTIEAKGGFLMLLQLLDVECAKVVES